MGRPTNLRIPQSRKNRTSRCKPFCRAGALDRPATFGSKPPNPAPNSCQFGKVACTHRVADISVHQSRTFQNSPCRRRLCVNRYIGQHHALRSRESPFNHVQRRQRHRPYRRGFPGDKSAPASRLPGRIAVTMGSRSHFRSVGLPPCLDFASPTYGKDQPRAARQNGIARSDFAARLALMAASDPPLRPVCATVPDDPTLRYVNPCSIITAGSYRLRPSMTMG